MNQGEIVIYKSDVDSNILEVRVEDETVWLTQAQLVNLFEASKQNISLHINNIFKEGELQRNSVVKEYLTTASDGKKYKTKYYNLDVIISVGYRVKSIRGTRFRIWATNILKSYLLKGYAIREQFEHIEKKMQQHDKTLLEHEQKFDLIIKSNLAPTEGIFYEGQIYDAWQFVSDLVKSAKKSIILIDNYLDDTVLTLLSKRNTKVKATIYTASISKQLRLDLEKHNAQYEAIDIKTFSKSHDRFLIIDEKTVYHIGASLKDLGKKWFAFSKIELDPKEMMDRLD